MDNEPVVVYNFTPSSNRATSNSNVMDKSSIFVTNKRFSLKHIYFTITIMLNRCRIIYSNKLNEPKWIRALSIYSSNQHKHQQQQQSSKSLCKLIEWSYREKHHHLLLSLVQSTKRNSDQLVSPSALRSCLSLVDSASLSKNPLFDQKTFACWIISKLPTVLQSNTSTDSLAKLTKWCLTTSSSNRIRLEQSHASCSSSSEEDREWEFKQQINLLARLRARGVVDGDPLNVAMFLQLANDSIKNGRSTRPNEYFLIRTEAERLYYNSSIPETLRNKEMKLAYRELIHRLTTADSKNTNLLSRQTFEAIRLRKSSKLIILDSNMLLTIALLRDVKFEKKHFTYHQFIREFNKHRASLILIPNIVWREVMTWLKRNDGKKTDELFRDHYGDDKKSYNVISQQIVLERLDQFEKELKWIKLNEEDEITSFGLLKLEIGKDVNAQNDDSVLQCAQKLSQQFQEKEIILATLDNGFRKRARAEIKFWP